MRSSSIERSGSSKREAGSPLVLGDDVFLIGDLETLRLLTQPLRLRLLETLRTGAAPMTVRELAQVLDMPPTRLYHHVNLLEERGLIRVAATRLVSGITEKRYAATAARVGVDRSLLTPAAGDETNRQTLEVLLAVILDEVRSEITRAVEAGLIDLALSAEGKIGPRRLILGRKWFRLTDAEVAELEERLFAATEHFAERAVASDAPEGPSEDEARLYELLIGFYPAVSPPLRELAGDEGSGANAAGSDEARAAEPGPPSRPTAWGRRAGDTEPGSPGPGLKARPDRTKPVPG